MTNCHSTGNATYCCGKAFKEAKDRPKLMILDNVKECDCSDGDTAEIFADFVVIETTIGFSPSTTSSTTSSTLYSKASSSTLTTTTASSTSWFYESLSTLTTAISSPSPSTNSTVLASDQFTNYGLDLGTGLGIPFGVLALAGIAYILYRYLHNKKSPAINKSPGIWSSGPKDLESPPAYENEVHEKPDDAVGYRQVPNEMPAENVTVLHEVDSGEIHEME
jgi:hypothetical protein